MDPASLSNASALLRAHDLRPRKRWGQNFLCDRNALDRIVKAAALRPDDRTLEIGPGLGALTLRLADLSSFVTAVEIDPLLEPVLQETLAGRTNVRIITHDFLKLDLSALLDEAFGPDPGVVVANIPYYITTPILEKLLAHKGRVARIVLLVQHEFAERLAARPATEAYGSMTVFAQFHTRVEIAGPVSRNCFLPAPEVASSIVVFTPVEGGTVPVRDERAFFRLVHAAFGQRRKTLPNALAGGDTDLDRAEAEALVRRTGIDPGRRGETLSLQEFAALADEFVQSR
jgi:16S rRNA (adenine1518-N6/adenine1519-N6)-dimethyltransferase